MCDLTLAVRIRGLVGIHVPYAASCTSGQDTGLGTGSPDGGPTARARLTIGGSTFTLAPAFKPMTPWNLRDDWWPISAWLVVFIGWFPAGDWIGAGSPIRIWSFPAAVLLAFYLRGRSVKSEAPTSGFWTIFAVLGLGMLVSGVLEVHETLNHGGGGIIDYGYTEGWEDESGFKRHRYAGAAGEIALGVVFLWLMQTVLTRRGDSEPRSGS